MIIILLVDKNNKEINEEKLVNIKIISSETYQTGRKRKLYLGLHSDLIAKYVDRTSKKTQTISKHPLNQKIYAEFQWCVDKVCVVVCTKEYSKSKKTVNA
ncbi:7775_t:CDS:2 [Funneliformis geosporum]|uniref:10387_t:CDS:1 n=1 Tax=Funneliformis geosporum TaxID=1117311 RepID=A0A9W4SI90_9GLOM|nr:7775_t:CDS:2 [Funneliformis geosporum]CAI2169959.1 10387_t:CDS:2 [Funneliformis geosporum]